MTFVGVDIGGTGISAALVDADGSLLATRGVPTPAGGEQMMAAAVGLVRELAVEHDTSIAAVGLGVAGVVDSQARTIVAASQSFTDWAGFDVGGYVDATLGVPNTVVNDVNAFLIGEMAWGAGRGLASAVGLTLGTGVGGAFWLDGALFAGPTGAAGELGHYPGFVLEERGPEPCTCGRTGHLESIASGRSIARRYRERVGRVRVGAETDDVLTAAEVANRADQDADAQAVFHEAGLMLGQLAVTMTTVLDVVDVIVGGGVAQAWDLLAPGIAEYCRRWPPVSGRTPQVVRGSLGSQAVAMGAAASLMMLDRR